MPTADELFDRAFYSLNGADPLNFDRPQPGFLPRFAGGVAKSMLDAVRLPGDVAAGKFDTAPSQPGMWSDEDEARLQLNDREAMNRAVDLAGTVMGGSYAAAPAQKNAVGAGIRAYHGSPHDFDRFDISKIGTGEGAQVYGHGLYFAENEAVARSYRDALAGRSLTTEVGRIDPAVAVDMMTRKIGEKLPEFGQPSQAAVWVFNRVHSGRTAQEIEKDISSMAWDAKQKDAALVALDATRGWKTNPRMYEVNINAKPEQFLPWDETLAYGGNIDQPELLDKVRAITPADKRKMLEHQVLAGLTGENVYKDILGANVRANTRSVIGALNEVGIPGIKYLDQGSRSAGEGSRNYVVFDDKLIDIIRKYGLAPGGFLGAYASSGGDAQAGPDFGAQMQQEIEAILAE